MKKKVLMSLLLLAIIGTSAVWAQTRVTEGNFTFQDHLGGGVQLSAVNNQIRGEVVVPSVAPNGRSVDQIAVGGYQNNTGITSVILPNSVRIINNNAFRGCTGLTSIVIPEGVTNINDYSFQGCTGLTSVTIPASMVNINAQSFQDCTNLTSVTFMGSNTRLFSTVGRTPFDGDLRAKYLAGGAGTYTRSRNGTVWTKQASTTVPCPHCNGTGVIRL